LRGFDRSAIAGTADDPIDFILCWPTIPFDPLSHQPKSTQCNTCKIDWFRRELHAMHGRRMRQYRFDVAEIDP
jgi:hypothetical protein